MRDANRLYKFYAKLTEVHVTHFPDWRFGQLMMNFLGYVQSTKRRDPFFPEEDEMLALLDEYVERMSGGNRND